MEVARFDTDFFLNPKGISYQAFLPATSGVVAARRLIVSVTRHEPQAGGLSNQQLRRVAPDGTIESFAPLLTIRRGIESKVLCVPASGPPVSMGGFAPGDVFVPTGDPWPAGVNMIARLDLGGTVVNAAWSNPNPGAGVGLWGGLTWDTNGTTYGGNMIAMTSGGSGSGASKLFKIVSSGSFSQLEDLDALGISHRPEGLAVSPLSFGPLADQVIVAVEGDHDGDFDSGKIWAVPGFGNPPTLLAQVPGTSEGVVFVPPLGGTLYLCELEFEGVRYNRILAVTASQLLPRRGRLIVHSEMMNEFHEISYLGGNDYTQAFVGRVPGPWTSGGLDAQSTELEAVCIAEQPPVHPDWKPWNDVPTQVPGVPFTTDLAPAAAAMVPATGDRGYLVAVANAAMPPPFTPNGIYYVKLQESVGTLVFDPTGWNPIDGSWPQPALHLTTQPLAAAVFDGKIYVVWVDDMDGTMRVWDNTYANTQFPPVVIGNQFERPAALAAHGKLVVAATRWTNSRIYINELPTSRALPPSGLRTPPDRFWSPNWTEVPGDYTLDPGTGPALAWFQGELYVFRTTGQVAWVIARDAEGNWTEWAEVPGGAAGGSSLVSFAAAGAAPGEPAGLFYTPYSANTGPFHFDSGSGSYIHRGYVPLAGQLHLFKPDPGTGSVGIQLASETGTWEPGWSAPIGTGMTDKAPAAMSVLMSDGNRTPRVYLFAKALGGTPPNRLIYTYGA